MTNMLQSIFSVTNINNHKILKVFGIKFKFKFNSKYTIQDCDKISKFITETMNNPQYFDMQQELYNCYEEMKTRKFYHIFKYRLSNKCIEFHVEEFRKRFNKDIVIISDVDNIPNNYEQIGITKIESLIDRDCIIVLAFNKDYAAIKIAHELTKYKLKYFSLTQSIPMARYFHTDENAYNTLEEESTNENWHFCPVDFENIFQAINITKLIDGDYVEIGTFKGDSASATLNYMQKVNCNKQAYFFDTFEGFDYNEAYSSEDGLWQNTHKETSFDLVRQRLSKYSNATVLKKNIITDDLPHEIEKISVCNIDVDMYEAVKSALYKVKDKIVKNGIIIAEDYGHTPGLIGAQKAVKEFLEENPSLFIPIYLNSGQLFMIKKGDIK